MSCFLRKIDLESDYNEAENALVQLENDESNFSEEVSSVEEDKKAAEVECDLLYYASFFRNFFIFVFVSLFFELVKWIMCHCRKIKEIL